MQANILAIIIGLLFVGLFVYLGVRVGPRFLITRLAGLVFVILGVTFVTFILGFISPGTPADNYCGAKCTAHQIALINAQFGLDKPWYVQYATLLNNLIHFNLGPSWAVRGATVWGVISRGLPISVQIGIMALVLQVAIGIPIGIAAAVRAGSRTDTALMGVALVTYSVPTFIVIPLFDLLMIYALSNHGLPSLPVSGWGQPIDYVAPVVILMLVGMGFYARLTRTTLLEVLNQDYIRTARAKGLRERVVIYRHALRNALVPLVTAIGPGLAFVVGGAFFTETLLAIPGIGYWAVSSIGSKDMPVVQMTVLLVAIAVTVMNVIVDLVYGLIDPRIKIV